MTAKLKLDVDALAVRSFATDEAAKDARGTVKARELSEEGQTESTRSDCDYTRHSCVTFDDAYTCICM